MIILVKCAIILFTVNTDVDNSVVCEISQDEKFAEINCTKPVKLYDDRGTLSKMQLHLCSESELNQILPNPGLVPFVQTMQNKTNCGVENLVQNKTCLAREDVYKTNGCEKMSDDDVDGVHDDLDDDVDAEEDDS